MLGRERGSDPCCRDSFELFRLVLYIYVQLCWTLGLDWILDTFYFQTNQ
jgi:hypothetical protein